MRHDTRSEKLAVTNLNRPKVLDDRGRQDSGIWYLVRLPDKWTVLAHKFSRERPEFDHSQYWEKTVAPMLAKAWNLSANDAAELNLCVYGFPRGRVVVSSTGGCTFFNGEDFAMFATLDQIADAFSVHADPDFKFDDHERCLWEDKQAVRTLLNLREDWPSDHKLD